MIKKLAAIVTALTLVAGLAGCAPGMESVARQDVVVPNVVGMTYGEAVITLRTAHLNVDHSYVPEGTDESVIDALVISAQTPQSGVDIAVTSTVVVTIPNPVPGGAAPTSDPTEAAAEADAAKLASQVKKALLDDFGLKHFREAQDQDPSLWAGYVTDIAGVGDGQVSVILDISDDDANSYGFDGSANAIMSLVGQENDDLRGVTVKTSKGTVLQTSVRSDIPILNG